MRQVQKDIISAVMRLQNTKSLLDIGCGEGQLSQAIATLLPQTFITALDVQYPKNSFRGSQIEFVQGNAVNLPFPSYYFDVVTASLSFHHWEDKEKGLCEACRVLKDGGRLILGDPLLDGPLRFRFLGWLAEKTDGGKFTSPGEMREYLNAAGFSPPDIRVVPGSLNTLYVITSAKL